MALKKPLVINSSTGFPEQLQTGDYINASNIPQYTNGEGSASLAIGMPVYISAADTVKRAQANASGTTFVIGLCNDPVITHGSTGGIAIEGVVTATTTQWDAVVTSESGGLTPGSNYFLDPANVGALTTTPPSTVGQYVCLVGQAISTTEMKINIGQPILL